MHMPRAQIPDLGTRRSGGSGDLRHGNLTQILRYVRDHGASSRHDIARGCGLGISTMTDLIGELRARRLVRELDPIRRPGAGRPTRPIAFDGEPWCVLGVHVDVDHIAVAATTVGGRELWRRPTEVDLRGAGPAGFGTLRGPAAQSPQADPGRQAAGGRRDRRAGVRGGRSGTVSTADGLDWQDFELGSAVDQTLARRRHRPGLRRRQQRVPACCALRQPGRARPAPGRASRPTSAACGTSAAALIIRGEIYRGAAGGGGDFGHLNVATGRTRLLVRPHRAAWSRSPVPPRCCLDRAGRPEGGRDLVDSDRERAIQMIFDAAQNGEPAATSALATAGSMLGRAVDDIIGAVNPHAVILGGYLGVLSPFLLPSCGPRSRPGWPSPPYAGTEILALEKLNAPRGRRRDPRRPRRLFLRPAGAHLPAQLTLPRGLPLSRAGRRR